MLDDDDFLDEFEKKTLLQRFGLPVGGGVTILVVGLSAYMLLRGGAGPAPRPHQEPHITQVQLPPPPPPPPPPKTPPPPKKPVEDKINHEPSPVLKPTPTPVLKPNTPPPALNTSIQGNGPGSLGLGNGGGGDCIGAGCGSGDGTGGDNDAYYASLMKTQIEDALRRDDRLKFARYRTTISFSLDAGGHVSGATIASFAGDNDVRAEVERVLRSVSTGDRPPADMLTKQFSVRITEHARG